MDFLRIGESKIKIVMSASELEKYGLSANDEGCSAASRRAVFEILEIAGREVGFDAEGDKILVQFYPMRDKGCEIFVTKLGLLSPSSSRLVLRSDKTDVMSKEQSFYFFSGISDVRRALTAVSGALGDRRVMLLSGAGTYILALSEIDDGRGLGDLLPLREFSTPVSEDVFVYATEHFDIAYSDISLAELKNIL